MKYRQKEARRHRLNYIQNTEEFMRHSGNKYRENVNKIRVTFTCPEVMTMAFTRGEVIRITLNKAPDDPDEFCRWLQSLINEKLGVK